MAQLGDHVGQILVIDPADALELRQRAPREQFQIVDQPRHARVVAVCILRLERQTFGKVARADPGRLERLHRRQRGLDLDQRHAELVRDLEQVAAQIAVLVDQLDQVPADEQLHAR